MASIWKETFSSADVGYLAGLGVGEVILLLSLRFICQRYQRNKNNSIAVMVVASTAAFCLWYVFRIIAALMVYGAAGRAVQSVRCSIEDGAKMLYVYILLLRVTQFHGTKHPRATAWVKPLHVLNVLLHALFLVMCSLFKHVPTLGIEWNAVTATRYTLCVWMMTLDIFVNFSIYKACLAARKSMLSVQHDPVIANKIAATSRRIPRLVAGVITVGVVAVVAEALRLYQENILGAGAASYTVDVFLGILNFVCSLNISLYLSIILIIQTHISKLARLRPDPTRKIHRTNAAIPVGIQTSATAAVTQAALGRSDAAV